MNRPSEHYLGESGRRYFAERFTSSQDFGRRWQSRYFQPYCGPDKTLLDFGCGDGTILRELPAARKLGVEVNPHCVARIKELNATVPVPIVMHADIAEVGSGTVDVLISNHCIEHVPEPWHTLAEFRRVLRPEGLLVLITPFDDWRIGAWREWSAGDRQNHLYTWSPMNIGNLLTEVGFHVRESRLQSVAWSPRIFWVHRLLGDTAFGLACRVLAAVTHRREVLSVARAATSS
jgi:SAM-dependent methyltransferase